MNHSKTFIGDYELRNFTDYHLIFNYYIFKEMMSYSSKMQEEKKSIKDMTGEEHMEYNRQFIRKLRETPEYKQHENITH